MTISNFMLGSIKKGIGLPLNPCLYIVGTPIGHLGDITIRALEILACVDAIACEDTRVSQVLLRYYGISKPLFACFDHNERNCAPQVCERIQKGQSIALISDAGMPLISDPGYVIVQHCIQQAVPVVVIPGASSILCALIASGQETDAFYFGGFWDEKHFESIAWLEASLVFFESPKRLLRTLSRLESGVSGFGYRSISVVRELTKLHESVVRGAIGEVRAHFETHPDTLRGEVVLVLGKPKMTRHREEWESALDALYPDFSLRDTVSIIQKLYAVPKRQIYRAALERLRPGESSEDELSFVAEATEAGESSQI
jgi:16S rRNA (cytidine1402-2'-O)-methyltransferase